MDSETSQQDIDAQITLLQRRRNALSPAGRIPAEVLSEILLLSTTTTDVPDRFAQRTENYIPTLCHVSRFWRSVALGCPRLWVEVDLEAKTLARRLDFVFKHAQPMPLSLHIDLEAGPRHPTRGQPITALQTATRLIWEAELSRLNFRGNMESLQDLIPVFPQGPSLRTVRISISREPDRDWRWEGPNLSHHIVLQNNVPQLRSLDLIGCTISPISPLLHGSSSLTDACLEIPQSSSLTELAGALRKIPRIKTLTLQFVHPLQHNLLNEVSVKAVPMPSLTSLALIGHALTITMLLSLLRMPALLLHLRLQCMVARGVAREGLLEVAGGIFGAVGQARNLGNYSSREDPPPFSPHSFAVSIQSSEGRSFAGVGKEVRGEGIRPTQITTMTLSIIEQETLRTVGCEDWLPLAAAPDLKSSLVQGCWSAAEVEIMTGDAVQYPDAFWRRISACPALVAIRIDAKNVLTLLPYIFSEHDGPSSQKSAFGGEIEEPLQEPESAFPFPSLRHIEVQNPNRSELRRRGIQVGHVSCSSVLEPFVNALEKRRELAMSHRSGGEVGTLDSLTFLDCDSAPSKVLVARLSTLVHRLVWTRRKPVVPAAIQPNTKLVVQPVPGFFVRLSANRKGETTEGQVGSLF